MVQLIYGPKGSGKTKRLIDMANAEPNLSNGDVVFIDNDKRYIYDVARQVRFVDVSEYMVKGEEKLYGMICGVLSQNFDITAIYIDAFVKIIGKPASETEGLLKELISISDAHKVKFVINVSGSIEDTPEFMKPYII